VNLLFEIMASIWRQCEMLVSYLKLLCTKKWHTNTICFLVVVLGLGLGSRLEFVLHCRNRYCP